MKMMNKKKQQRTDGLKSAFELNSIDQRASGKETEKRFSVMATCNK